MPHELRASRLAYAEQLFRSTGALAVSAKVERAYMSASDCTATAPFDLGGEAAGVAISVFGASPHFEGKSVGRGHAALPEHIGLGLM